MMIQVFTAPLKLFIQGVKKRNCSAEDDSRLLSRLKKNERSFLGDKPGCKKWPTDTELKLAVRHTDTKLDNLFVMILYWLRNQKVTSSFKANKHQTECVCKYSRKWNELQTIHVILYLKRGSCKRGRVFLEIIGFSSSYNAYTRKVMMRPNSWSHNRSRYEASHLKSIVLSE